MKNILIFPCGSEVGLEIYKSLEYSKEFELFGASSVDDHGKFIHENYIPNLPFIEDENFIEVLKKIIQQYKIDYIFPAHDSAVVKLAKNQSELQAKVITSPLETCEICRSKRSTYEKFKNIIKVPEIFNISDDLNKELFLKPDKGQGSKGVRKTSTQIEVKSALEKDPSLLILEYLPGKEYTIDCFTDKNGKLLFAQGRERMRIINGISVNARPVKDALFKEIAEKINNELKFRGVWFYQLKENVHGELVLLEIAPRVAGTMALCRIQGANLPLMSLFDAMDLNVSVLINDFDIEIDRALHARFKTDITYEHVYIDFDDTLIFKNKVNILLMSFIYQCLNNNKKVYLITKHEKDIFNTLKKYRISENIFNEIIVINKDEEKYKFIKSNSIFIDDSFSERKKVYTEKGIPVFSMSEMSCLFEGRNAL